MDVVPAKLKPAEVGRFIHRANQLRPVKPAITYWCEYHAVNQILAKQLHNADEECLAFTTELMDRLEKMKNEHADDDAITDDTTGQAYVEQFAQQTLDRGEKVLRADKVTRQTADTFDAAATFFQLTSVWGPPDEETQKKIKFAKWNAARILRAIKEGRDPNETNPKPDEAAPEEDDNGGDVHEAEPSKPAAAAAAAGSPAMPPAPQHATAFTPPSPISQPSPTHPADHVPSPYSRVSQSPAQPSQPSQPQSPGPPAGAGAGEPFASPPMPPRHSLHFPEAAAADAYTPPPVDLRPTFPGPSVMAGAPKQQGKAPTSAPWPQANPSLAPSTHGFGQQYPQSQSPANAPAGTGHHPLAQSPAGPGAPLGGAVDDVSISKAEKHAKWAISALNFDDVPTAVKELRNALETLGAR